MFRHVVLFRVRDGVEAALLSDALAALRSLGRKPGVVSWSVATSLDDRKGTVIVEDGTFEDAESFRSWRETDDHRRAAEMMKRISDWLVADWEAPAELSQT